MKRNITIILSMLICMLTSIYGQEIKIMSFNMQQPYSTNWDSRVANAASIINTQQPDILGTQELHGYMKDQILSRVSGYAFYGISRECDGSGESSYIFYKTSKYEIDNANSGNFWFKDDYWNCGRGYDPEYNRIGTFVRFKEKATGKYFYVYNSHFPTPGQYNARVKSASLLCQIAINRAIKDPVIFTGDFNSTEEEGNPIAYIKNGSSLKMRDTYRDIDPTGVVKTGFGTRYDFIFIENQSTNTTLSSYVVNSPVASDHSPIVATVRLGTTSNPTVPYGQIIWLQNSSKYISSNNGGTPITCDRTSVQGWEKFKVVDAGGGKIALQGSNGKYISSENGAAVMTCTRATFDGWEKFDWVKVGSNQVALRGNNGRYVSSENGATTGMNCNRETYQGWEVFNWGVTTMSALVATDISAEIMGGNLFPNPCDNQLYYNNTDAASSISIFDLNGRLILNQTLTLNTNEINVRALKQGLYVAKVFKDNSVNIIKVVKK